MMKIFLETFGCTANKADGALIMGILKAKKHRFVQTAQEADLVLINSCGVKQATESRAVSNIKKYLAMEKRVLVAGCLPAINPKLLLRFPISIVDLNSYARLGEALEEIRKGKEVQLISAVHSDKLSLPMFCDDTLTGIIPISEGCLGACAFCATHFARGELKSYPANEIVRRIRLLLSKSKKEILITAQDCGCYGLDIGTNIAELLKQLCALDGDFRIRVGMMNPQFVKKMMPQLIDAFQNKKMYSFLHVPVQSGSDKVLKEMRRGHSAKNFELITRAFRKEFPDITIATDIIVGFPSETDADFEKTLGLIKRTKPDIINISKFYPRPNTPAAKMKLLPTQVLKQRSTRLAALCRRIITKQNSKLVGKTLKCLATGETTAQGQALARAPNYKQVILEGKAKPEFCKVKITGAGARFLRGNVI